VFKTLPPGGVRELTIHPGMMTPEMQATTGAARFRTADTEYFSRKSTIEWIRAQGVKVISYRELRALQRTGKPLPRRETQ